MPEQNFEMKKDGDAAGEDQKQETRLPFHNFQEFLRHLYKDQTNLHTKSLDHADVLVDELRDEFLNKIKFTEKKQNQNKERLEASVQQLKSDLESRVTAINGTMLEQKDKTDKQIEQIRKDQNQ